MIGLLQQQPSSSTKTIPTSTTTMMTATTSEQVAGGGGSSSGLHYHQHRRRRSLLEETITAAAVTPVNDPDHDEEDDDEQEGAEEEQRYPSRQHPKPQPGLALRLRTNTHRSSTGSSSRYSATSSTTASSTTSSVSRSSKKSPNINGNTIDSEHDQYELSVAMMVGMRCVIGKTHKEEMKLEEEAARRKHKKMVTMEKKFKTEDYAKIERYVFPLSKKDVDGEPITDSKLLRTFKFRAYAPRVFSKIRKLFGIDTNEFVESLCGDEAFIEFMSNSCSGEFFFYTQDGRYMIKTQNYSEIKFLRQILPHYYQYVVDNPNTFLTHYYGVFHVKLPHSGLNVPFVIMKSVFDTEKRITQMWDLKGSTLGRKAKVGDSVQKDLDIVENGDAIHIGSRKKNLVMEQLRKDSSFLAEMNIMDYSLLVGVHRREDDRNFVVVEPSRNNLDSEEMEIRSALGMNSPLPDADVAGEAATDNDDGKKKQQLKKGKTLDVRQMRELAHLFLQQATDENGEEEEKDQEQQDQEEDPTILEREREDPSLVSSSSQAITRTNTITPTPSTDSSVTKFVYDNVTVGDYPDDEIVSSQAMNNNSTNGGGGGNNSSNCGGNNNNNNSIHHGPAVVEYTKASHDQVEVLWVTEEMHNHNDNNDCGDDDDNVEIDGGNYNGRITERPDLGIDSWMIDAETMQSKEIYFIGIIDILQRYTTRKFIEHHMKATHQNAEEISCVDPEMYADRFVKFMDSVME